MLSHLLKAVFPSHIIPASQFLSFNFDLINFQQVLFGDEACKIYALFKGKLSSRECQHKFWCSSGSSISNAAVPLTQSFLNFKKISFLAPNAPRKSIKNSFRVISLKPMLRLTRKWRTRSRGLYLSRSRVVGSSFQFSSLLWHSRLSLTLMCSPQ